MFGLRFIAVITVVAQTEPFTEVEGLAVTYLSMTSPRTLVRLKEKVKDVCVFRKVSKISAKSPIVISNAVISLDRKIVQRFISQR